MSLVKKNEISFNEISNFLAEHPDFFIHYPELLKHLYIPHVSGHNIHSLIEYQVSSLQNANLSLEKENAFLTKDLENQLEFTRSIHNCIPRIFDSVTPDELYLNFYKCMKKYYLANRARILLFAEPSKSISHEEIKFTDTNDKLRFMFTEIFHRRKPLCNSLQEEHIKALFQVDIGEIKSTVLLPVSINDERGLIILGSKTSDCYRHGFELEILVFISRIVFQRITDLLK